jgi:hypothetical protein
MVLGLCALGATADVITSDSHFYGQSPPVYPSRMSPLTPQYPGPKLVIINQSSSEHNRDWGLERVLYQGKGACCSTDTRGKGMFIMNL